MGPGQMVSLAVAREPVDHAEVVSHENRGELSVEFQVRHFGGVVVFGVVFGSCVQEAAEFWVRRVFECNFRGKSTVLSGRRRHHKPRAQRAAE